MRRPVLGSCAMSQPTMTALRREPAEGCCSFDLRTQRLQQAAVGVQDLGKRPEQLFGLRMRSSDPALLQNASLLPRDPTLEQRNPGFQSRLVRTHSFGIPRGTHANETCRPRARMHGHAAARRLPALCAWLRLATE